MENFLQEIYRRVRTNQVGIFIDGENLKAKTLESLPILKDRLKEVGEIRFAQVMYENNIPEEQFEQLRASGFKDIIVPGNIELSFLLEVYDVVLDKMIDFIVLGTTSEELIPLFTELRKSVTVFAFIDHVDKVSKGFIESIDGYITPETVADFTFHSSDFTDFEEIINGGGTRKEIESSIEQVPDSGDEANIGTFSEELIEDDLIEKMKKEQKE